MKDPNFKGIGFVGKVKSKGGDWRDFVMISDEIKNLLRQILFTEREEKDEESYLFSCTTESKKEKG